MRDAFAASKLGRAAAAELAEPPERTEKGAAQHDLDHALAYLQQCRQAKWQPAGHHMLSKLQLRPWQTMRSQQICHHFHAHRSSPGRATLVHTKFALSWWRSFKACMRRELTLFYRNRVVRTCLHACVWPVY